MSAIESLWVALQTIIKALSAFWKAVSHFDFAGPVWASWRWLIETAHSQAPALFPLMLAVFAGGITVAVAIMARNTALRVMREKATLELIEKRESTEYYISKNLVFSALRRGIGFDHLHEPKTPEHEAERRSVLGYLNHYELVALGIQRGVLDNSFYREWMGTAFVREWSEAQDFIWRERHKKNRKETGWEYTPLPFKNFEKIACQWDPAVVPLKQQPLRRPPPYLKPGSIDDPIPHLEGEEYVEVGAQE